jgi:hypothetical protein
MQKPKRTFDQIKQDVLKTSKSILNDLESILRSLPDPKSMINSDMSFILRSSVLIGIMFEIFLMNEPQQI